MQLSTALNFLVFYVTFNFLCLRISSPATRLTSHLFHQHVSYYRVQSANSIADSVGIVGDSSQKLNYMYLLSVVILTGLLFWNYSIGRPSSV